MQKRTLQLMDNKKNREESLSHYGAELTNKLCIPPSELGTQQEEEGRREIVELMVCYWELGASLQGSGGGIAIRGGTGQTFHLSVRTLPPSTTQRLVKQSLISHVLDSERCVCKRKHEDVRREHCCDIQHLDEK